MSSIIRKAKRFPILHNANKKIRYDLLMNTIQTHYNLKCPKLIKTSIYHCPGLIIPNMCTTLDQINEDFVKRLNNGNLCLDGTTCVGKSSIFPNLSKVNHLMNVEEYNISPPVAFNYLCTGLSLCTDNPNTTIIDRSPISNIAFQFVYYIMKKYANSDRTLFGLCEEYMQLHNMEPMLEFIKSLQLPILIFIKPGDVGVAELMERMRKRANDTSSLGDAYKCNNEMYFIAQNAAYEFLGRVLGYPVLVDIDMLKFREKLTALVPTFNFDSYETNLVKPEDRPKSVGANIPGYENYHWLTLYYSNR